MANDTLEEPIAPPQAPKTPEDETSGVSVQTQAKVQRTIQNKNDANQKPQTSTPAKPEVFLNKKDISINRELDERYEAYLRLKQNDAELDSVLKGVVQEPNNTVSIGSRIIEGRSSASSQLITGLNNSEPETSGENQNVGMPGNRNRSPQSGVAEDELPPGGPPAAPQPVTTPPPAAQPQTAPSSEPDAPEQPQQTRFAPPYAGKIKKVKELAEVQKGLGTVTSKIWYYGFGSSTATFFIGLDFMLGALIMDFYWIALHRKDKELFPLKLWQKAVTIFANVAPIFTLLFILFILLFTACNLPGAQYAELFTGTSVCSSLNANSISNAILSNVNAPAQPASPAGGTCSAAPSGPASIAALSSTCFGQNAGKASAISFAESGGVPDKASRTDVCHGDGKAFSWGLFQINLLVHTIQDPGTGQTLQCPTAFIKGSPYVVTNSSGNFLYYDCSVTNQALYTQCVNAATNPASNIQSACQISGNGTNWSAWSTNKLCKF